jgi:hypothetical protein
MTLHRTAEDRARFYALRAELNDLNADAAAARKESRRAQRKATKAARAESPMKDQREPREHDAPYLAWIRGLKCVGCVQDQTPSRSMRSEAAHVRFADARAGWKHTGKGEKPHDRRTLPLCLGHHREGPKSQHAAGERAWWEARGIYPPDLCAAVEVAFEAGADGNEVIRRHAANARSVQPALSRWSGGEADCETSPNTSFISNQGKPSS